MPTEIISNKKNNVKRNLYRKNLYIFLFCFIFSSLIWFLTKLSQEYNETITFPVVFTNLPSDKIVTNNLDTILTLELKTKGFNLLSSNIFFKTPIINIDVALFLKKKKNEDNIFYIESSNLKQIIGKQLHFSKNISSVKPDSIFFKMEKMYKKKVEVKLNLNISFEQQYNLVDSIKCQPDSVLVFGTKNIIDTINFIETDTKTLTNINSTKNITIEFAKKYKDYKLRISPSKINIFIPVQKFTEASIELPIVVVNNTLNYSVKMFPEKINLTYLVSLDNYKNVKSSMFSATVDISNTLISKSKKLKVNITKHPSFVKIKQIDPEKIEYILLK